MIYYCPFAHPSVIMRKRFYLELKYESGSMEDYRLWISHINNRKVRFANIGSVLFKLRKHTSNVSGTH